MPAKCLPKRVWREGDETAMWCGRCDLIAEDDEVELPAHEAGKVNAGAGCA